MIKNIYVLIFFLFMAEVACSSEYSANFPIKLKDILIENKCGSVSDYYSKNTYYPPYTIVNKFMNEGFVVFILCQSTDANDFKFLAYRKSRTGRGFIPIDSCPPVKIFTKIPGGISRVDEDKGVVSFEIDGMGFHLGCKNGSWITSHSD